MSTEYAHSPFVYTGRWQMARDTLAVVPVRASIGLPKFLANADRYPAIKDLCPWGLMQIDDRPEFTARYFNRLDRIGVDVVQEHLDSIARDYQGRPLMLCCYEDLTKRGEWCHRLVFSEWWFERTGQVIADLQLCELGDAPAAVPQPPPAYQPLQPESPPEPAQDGLF